MIKVVDVSHHYGIRPVLSKINLEICPGQIVTIMGPNGAGKSTLLQIIAGILSPAAGYVEINGLRRRANAEDELKIRRQTVFLPDHPWLPENTTVREWLWSIAELYDVESRRLMDHIGCLLEVFQLVEKGESPIRSCSNGQKKKVAIYAALAAEVPILILDEPYTGGLDPAAIIALGRVLKTLAERKGATIIMASQIAEMAGPVADRIVILDNNQVRAFGTLEEIQAMTHCKGSLPEVFEKLVHPQSAAQIENYFNRLDQ